MLLTSSFWSGCSINRKNYWYFSLEQIDCNFLNFTFKFIFIVPFFAEKKRNQKICRLSHFSNSALLIKYQTE